MKKLTTKQVTTLAMFIALTTVATMLIQIPIPATKGYLNIGDTILICAGLLMGKIAGGIVGGLGPPWPTSLPATPSTPPSP